MLTLLSAIMILFLLVHWFILVITTVISSDIELKCVCFSLFCVEFIFVIGNLLVRFL